MMRTTLRLLAGGLIFLFLAGPIPAANKKHLPGALSDTKFEMVTNYGTIVLELEPQKAPLSCANFRQYVAEKYYDGLIFHRVIPNFMIQGGAHMPDMSERKGRSPVAHESFNGLKNGRGAVAVARAVDPNSGTSQFFINLRDNPMLNGDEKQERFGYTVFAHVVEGMDIVDKIAAQKTGSRNAFNDVPLEPVIIKSIRPATK